VWQQQANSSAAMTESTQCVLQNCLRGNGSTAKAVNLKAHIKNFGK
jgi:hypothetical protein